jgi:hypothetical protein
MATLKRPNIDQSDSDSDSDMEEDKRTKTRKMKFKNINWVKLNTALGKATSAFLKPRQPPWFQEPVYGREKGKKGPKKPRKQVVKDCHARHLDTYFVCVTKNKKGQQCCRAFERPDNYKSHVNAQHSDVEADKMPCNSHELPWVYRADVINTRLMIAKKQL